MSRYYRPRDFLLHTISAYQIARSNKFVLRIPAVITLSPLPCQGVLNWVTLHWIGFLKLGYMEEGACGLHPPGPSGKRKRDFTKRHLQTGGEPMGLCLVYKLVCKWSGRLWSLTQPGPTWTPTQPLGTHRTSESSHLWASVSSSLKCLLHVIAVKIGREKTLLC